MRIARAIGVLGVAGGCGARHVPPEPLPEIALTVGVEQAIVAQSELLLVGLQIGSNNPDGVVVDEVEASAVLKGVDLGDLGLVPMMEAHMPPWTLMLMWRIPADSVLDVDAASSVTGTVTWHVGSAPQNRTAFELPLVLVPDSETEVAP